jgi:hypothetical protein
LNNNAPPATATINVSDLIKMTPVQFLDVLKTLKERNYDQYKFRHSIKNWITKKDVPELISLTKSKDPCASVSLMASQIWDRGEYSTVGQEAIFMLEGYQKGEYPPAQDSFRISDIDTKELIKWCQDQMRQINRP